MFFKIIRCMPLESIVKNKFYKNDSYDDTQIAKRNIS